MQTLYIKDREEWRAWLEKKHDAVVEVWLIFYKKHTGKPSIHYNDSVEEAICFGWIDSLVRRMDDEKYTRKFSPRKGKSKWSELNIQRAEKMIRERKMTEAGLVKFKERVNYDKYFPEDRKSEPEMPPELNKALKQNKKAWENFNNFAPSYRKQYILWVASAKREETRRRRIEQTVRLSEENKKTGMM